VVESCISPSVRERNLGAITIPVDSSEHLGSENKVANDLCCNTYQLAYVQKHTW